MGVHVAAVLPRALATLALEREGHPHVEHVLDNPYGYSELVAGLWQQGDGFTVLEHDVIPWVGAMAELEACDGLWCQFPYPFAANAVRCALGCVRFSDPLVRDHPDLHELWAGVEWNQLDGRVIPAVEHVAGRACVHGPAFAHVKGA